MTGIVLRSASTTSMPFFSLPCCKAGKVRSGNCATLGTPLSRATLLFTVVYFCSGGRTGAGLPVASGSPLTAASCAAKSAPGLAGTTVSV